MRNVLKQFIPSMQKVMQLIFIWFPNKTTRLVKLFIFSAFLVILFNLFYYVYSMQESVPNFDLQDCNFACALSKATSKMDTSNKFEAVKYTTSDGEVKIYRYQEHVVPHQIVPKVKVFGEDIDGGK